jgi:hypothetical protein
VILVQKGNVPSHSTKSIDPLSISKIVGIERNPCAQIYRVPSLSSCIHFSSSKAHIKAIESCINQHKKMSNPKSADITTTIIDCKTNHQCKSSSVYNISKHLNSNEDKILHQTSRLLHKSCIHGLLSSLSVSDTNRGRSFPSLSYGWSLTNSHQYSANRCNILGNIMPFLSEPKNFKALPTESKYYLFEAIYNTIQCCPHRQHFNIKRRGPKNKKQMNTRVDYRDMFNESFQAECGIKRSSKDKELSCEAFSVIIPSCIRAHRDTLNDNISGMKGVIQFNCMLPLESQVVNDVKLLKLLQSQGFTTEFPLSIICYSRKVVGNYSDKIENMNKFMSDNRDGHGVLRSVIGRTIMHTETNRNCYTTFESTDVITSSLVYNQIKLYDDAQDKFRNSIQNRKVYYKRVRQMFSKEGVRVDSKSLFFQSLMCAMEQDATPNLKWQDTSSHMPFPLLHCTFTGPTLSFDAGFDKMVSSVILYSKISFCILTIHSLVSLAIIAYRDTTLHFLM